MGVGGKWGGRLFEAGRLLTFSAFRMGAYSRWALIRGWALIRINTVCYFVNSTFFSQFCICYPQNDRGLFTQLHCFGEAH